VVRENLLCLLTTNFCCYSRIRLKSENLELVGDVYKVRALHGVARENLEERN